MKKVIIVLLCAIIAGCAAGNVEKNMKSWLGHTRMELLSVWGPPTQIMSDGNEGEVFIYDKSTTYTTPGQLWGQSQKKPYGKTTGYAVYVPGQTIRFQSYRMFFIDSSGRIYYVSWKM